MFEETKTLKLISIIMQYDGKVTKYISTAIKPHMQTIFVLYL